MNARGNSLSVAAEEGPTELGDEVGEAANNDEEVEHRKIKARWDSAESAWRPPRRARERLEKENQEGARKRATEAAKKFSRAPLALGTAGPEGRARKNGFSEYTRQIATDRSISIRART